MSIISQAREILGPRKWRALIMLADGMDAADIRNGLTHCESSPVPLSQDISALEQWFGVQSLNELQVIGRALIEIGAR